MSREKSFPDKLKKWLQSGGVTTATTNTFSLTKEQEVGLSSTSSLSTRLRTVGALTDIFKAQKIEEHGIEKVWCLVKDLLDVEKMPPRARMTTLRMLTTYAHGEQEMGNIRMIFINHIKSSCTEEDHETLFNFFRAVLSDGRRMDSVEHEVGPIYAQWLPLLLKSPVKKEALELTTNLIKFQSAYTDCKIVEFYVKEVIRKMHSAEDEEEALLCMTVLETVVAYRYLPSSVLSTALIGMCRLVNVSHLTERVVKVVRNILTTTEASTAYDMLMRIIDRGADFQLVRSAMFFCAYFTFGIEQLTSLKYRKRELMQAMCDSLSEPSPMSREVLVLYEVSLSLLRLLLHPLPKLTSREWNLALDVLSQSYKGLERMEDGEQRSSIHAVLGSAMSGVEHFIEDKQFNGSIDKFHNLMDRAARHLPVPSVMKVIDNLKVKATPPKNNWVKNLYALVKKYFVNDPRDEVKMKALMVLHQIYLDYRPQHGSVIVESIVTKLFVGYEKLPSLLVRNLVVTVIDSMVTYESCPAVEDLLGLMEDLLMVNYKRPDCPALTSADTPDISITVTGLVVMLRKRSWQSPSKFAVIIYDMLIRFLDQHYQKPEILEQASLIRFKVFLFIMGMNCNERNELGFTIGELSAIEDRLRGSIEPYTPFVVVSPKERSSQELQETSTCGTEADDIAEDVSVICLGDVGRVLLKALEMEKDWEVLEQIVRVVRENLHWKTYVLAFSDGKMDLMASRVCRMVYDASLNYPKCLTFIPEPLSRSKFESNLYPLLAQLVAHHQYLHSMTQRKLIRSLQLGVMNKDSGQLCIEAITLCVMEMPQAMGKEITRIISHFAKITQSVTHSQSMLEFLSTLLHFPRLYSSFVETQYKCVFAIAIPYTNPFKFNHYIVSLAFHVIAMWFLKCHLPFRRQIVKFITTSLMKKFEILVLTYKQRATPVKVKSKISKKEKAKLKEKLDEEERNLRKLHVFTDLMETCFDLMSRYVFAYCKPVSERPSTMAMLVKGKCKTWITGNKLISITTSGCVGRQLKPGVCDICQNYCSKGPPDLRKVNMDELVLDDAPKESSPVSKPAPKATPRSTRPDSTQTSPVSRPESSSSESRAPSLNPSQPCSPTSPPSPSRQPPSAKSPFSFLSQLSPSRSRAKCTHRSPSHSSESPSPSPSSIPSQPSFSHSSRAQPTLPSPSHSSKSPSPSSKSRSGHPSPISQPSPSPQQSPSDSSRYSSPPYSPLSQLPTVSAQSLPTGKPPLRPSTFPRSLFGHSSPSNPRISPSSKGSPSSPASRQHSSLPSPSTPRSPPFPFAHYPELSPFLSSPTSSLGLSYTSDSSQGASLSFTSESSQGTSPERPAENATTQYSPYSLYLQNLTEKRNWKEVRCFVPLPRKPAPAAAAPAAEVDGGRQSHPKVLTVGTPPRLQMPMLPPRPQDVAKELGLKPGMPIVLHKCSCWCRGWAELYMRQPCGNFSVMMTIQNRSFSSDDDILTLGDISELPSPFWKDMPGKATRGRENPDPAEAVGRGGGKQGGDASSVQKTKTKTGAIPKEHPHVEARSPGTVEEDVVPESLSPSFVFLQLYYDGLMPTDDRRPVLLPTEQMEMHRSLKLLDLIKPCDTHKIGVLYVRKGQTLEQEILSNSFGSLRYMQFLYALGSYVELTNLSQDVFLGGLDTSGVDGKNTLIWHDDLLQVVFHVATMMPTRDSDPRCNGKKRHIGNNYVTIVYNDSDKPYGPHTIKGQFNHIVIEIVPNYKDTNTVKLHCQPQMLNYLKGTSARLVSNASLPMLVRQMAVHSNLAAKIFESLTRPPHTPYANNWVERLRHIRRICNNVQGNIRKSDEKFGAPELNDFADLTDVTVRNREPNKSGKYSIQLMY